jgi:hypothetical protein
MVDQFHMAAILVNVIDKGFRDIIIVDKVKPCCVV